MSGTNKRHPRVKEAFQLGGEEEAIKEFYADWAENYDKDTAGIHYSACQSTYDLLTALPNSEFLTVDISDKSLRIMDVGCGTGLMGEMLKEHGYTNIDGCDISLEMTLEADKLGVYTLTLIGKTHTTSVSVLVYSHPAMLNQKL